MAEGEVTHSPEEEQRHFQDVFTAFAFYRAYALRRVDTSERYIKSMPARHLIMLQPRIGQRQEALRQAVDVNHIFVKEMLHSCRGMFVNSAVTNEVPALDAADRSGTGNGGCEARGDRAAPGASVRPFTPEPSPFTMDKVATTLKQFYRDWSKEGEAERQACYTPLIDMLEHYCPIQSEEFPPPRVLVPGSGLGRLAFEISRHGYECQGNEFSMHMLIGSNFILNRPPPFSPMPIHPWALGFCNNLSSADQLQSVLIPDVLPAAEGCSPGFSMCAGDFLEVYTEPEQWNCVVTCFFLDTARNPLAYIECIERILVPGGFWLNLGPLLWHWADVKGEESIELSYEDLRHVIVEKFGFTMLREEVNVRCGYIQNPAAMMKTDYDCVMFAAQKPFTDCCHTNGTHQCAEPGETEPAVPF